MTSWFTFASSDWARAAEGLLVFGVPLIGLCLTALFLESYHAKRDRAEFLAANPALRRATPIEEREPLDVVVRWKIGDQRFEAVLPEVSDLKGAGWTADQAVSNLEERLLERLARHGLTRDTKVVEIRRLVLIRPATTM